MNFDCHSDATTLAIGNSTNRRDILRILLVILASLPLCGCLTAQQMAENQRKDDDTNCRSMGGIPGTDAYMNCRMAMMQRRDVAAAQQQEMWMQTTAIGASMIH
jgi:hypothetical protein